MQRHSPYLASLPTLSRRACDWRAGGETDQESDTVVGTYSVLESLHAFLFFTVDFIAFRVGQWVNPVLVQISMNNAITLHLNAHHSMHANDALAPVHRKHA